MASWHVTRKPAIRVNWYVAQRIAAGALAVLGVFVAGQFS